MRQVRPCVWETMLAHEVFGARDQQQLCGRCGHSCRAWLSDPFPSLNCVENNDGSRRKMHYPPAVMLLDRGLAGGRTAWDLTVVCGFLTLYRNDFTT